MTMSREGAYRETLALWARLEGTPTPNEHEVVLPADFYEDKVAAFIAERVAGGAMTDVLDVMTRIAEAAGHSRFRDPASESCLLNGALPGAEITPSVEAALKECARLADDSL